MRFYKLKVIILTKGTDGSCVLSRDCKSILGTPKVKVASAVGAGDYLSKTHIKSFDLDRKSLVLNDYQSKIRIVT